MGTRIIRINNIRVAELDEEFCRECEELCENTLEEGISDHIRWECNIAIKVEKDLDTLKGHISKYYKMESIEEWLMQTLKGRLNDRRRTDSCGGCSYFRIGPEELAYTKQPDTGFCPIIGGFLDRNFKSQIPGCLVSMKAVENKRKEEDRKKNTDSPE